MRNQKENRQVYNFPPSRICGVCVNRMNDLCLEECALKKDYRYFDPDPDRDLETLPCLTMKEFRELNGKAKGEWIFYRLEKFIGGENGRDFNYSASRRLLANLKKQSLLVSPNEPAPPPENRKECEDQDVRSGEMVGECVFNER